MPDESQPNVSEQPPQRSVDELTSWAIDEVLKDYEKEKGLAKIFAYPGKMRAEKALKSLTTSDLRPALKVIKNEAETLADQVSLGNTLAEIWVRRTYDMEGSPLQQRAMLYFGLEKLLERKLLRQDKSKYGLRYGADKFSQIDRLQEMRLTRDQKLNSMSDEEMLNYLYEIKKKLSS